MATQSELLVEAQQQLKEMQAELKRLSESGLRMEIVMGCVDKFAVMSSGIYALNGGKFKQGDTVLVHPMSGQIVQKADILKYGDISTVSSYKDGVLLLEGRNGDARVVLPGKFNDLKQGDKVLCDPGHNLVLHVVERAKQGKPVAIKSTKWSDVGGHTEAKQLLIEAVELPYKHPELYRHYNKGTPNGLLMWGPPGCGKTLLAKATATAIGADGAFLSIKGPEVLDPFVGVAEGAIRSIFRKARDYKNTTGKPALIFIDEADALLTRRSSRGNFMGQTIVPTFLTEMDGLDDSGAIVVLATNRPDTLDEAVIRDGRIDHKIEIKRPDAKEAVSIFGIHVGNKPIHPQHTKRGLVEFAISKLYNGHKLPHSGALIAGCVDKAVTAALRRDLAAGKRTGLHESDFAWACDQIVQQEVLGAEAKADTTHHIRF